MTRYKYAPKYVYDQIPAPKAGHTYIYGLRKVGHNWYSYIGSSNKPRNRFHHHFHAAAINKLGNKKLAKWLNKNRMKCEMVILECVPNKQRALREKDWITSMYDQGHGLLNLRLPTREHTKKDVKNLQKHWERLLTILDT